MGREVRMVPANWQHPQEKSEYTGELRFVPLFDGDYESAASGWDEGWRKWQQGLCENYSSDEKWTAIEPEYQQMRYTGYAGSRPSPDDYMPQWPTEMRTHFMMYETTSEGTPISPAFETPEELALWLADNEASAFARHSASYEHWLAVAKGGWAPSMVVSDGSMKSGVEFMGQEQSQ